MLNRAVLLHRRVPGSCSDSPWLRCLPGVLGKALPRVAIHPHQLSTPQPWVAQLSPGTSENSGQPKQPRRGVPASPPGTQAGGLQPAGWHTGVALMARGRGTQILPGARGA